jgi:hypothetical protein
MLEALRRPKHEKQGGYVPDHTRDKVHPVMAAAIGEARRRGLTLPETLLFLADVADALNDHLGHDVVAFQERHNR